MKSLEEQGTEDQFAQSRAVVMRAIYAIPVGILAGNAKVLLAYMASLADPVSWILGATQPELAEGTGTSPLTTKELLEKLFAAKVAVIVRRLYRGEKDRRAPLLADGGNIVRIQVEHILELARLNEVMPRTRFLPIDERALKQNEERKRELDVELARPDSARVDELEHQVQLLVEQLVAERETNTKRLATIERLIQATATVAAAAQPAQASEAAAPAPKAHGKRVRGNGRSNEVCRHLIAPLIDPVRLAA